MVLGYFILRFKSWDGFKIFFYPLSVALKTDNLDTKRVAASCLKYQEVKLYIFTKKYDAQTQSKL